MERHLKYFFLISILLIFSTLHASDFQRYSILPIFAYNEETQLQMGLMSLFFLEPKHPDDPISSLDFAIYGTTRKQLQILFSPDLYLYQNKIHLDTEFLYWNWVGHYYGIGNTIDYQRYQTYDMQRFSITIPVQSSLGIPQKFDFFNYGLVWHSEHNKTQFRKSGLELEKPNIHQGFRNALGYSLTIDTKNHPQTPSQGFYIDFEQRYYLKLFDSPFFISQHIDLRYYQYLFWNTTLALGGLYQSTFGKAPFDMLAMPDGVKRFRGIEKGTFRDQQALVLQTEFRRPLFWRLAGVLFYEVSKVGPYFSALYREDFHHAYGFGGRLALNKKERIYLRSDFSIIDNKQLGITIHIREAF